jgi:hypothetical protein
MVAERFKVDKAKFKESMNKEGDSKRKTAA